MVPLDRALVSSYRLRVVTTQLTEAVWPQFAMQIFGGVITNQYSRLEKWGATEDLNLYHSVAVGQPYLILQTVFFWFSHNTYVTDDRQTDGHNIVP